MLDLGDIYPATVEVKNSAGALVNATTMTFTFTLPDATTTSPAPSNPSIGRYEHDLLTTQLGLHRFRAVATGPNAAWADVFTVHSLEAFAFVGLAEVKEHLNIPAADTSADEELRGFILSSCEVVEDIVGVVARRTFTQTLSGRGEPALLLSRRPVIAVTSVTVDGTAVTDYSVTPHGVLTRTTAYRAGRWPSGVDNIVVTYTAGRTSVPAGGLDGTKELIRINWRPQQGGNYSPFNQGRGDEHGQQARGAGEIRLGFFVPNTVMQRLQPSARGPHVA